jgi:murein DD-endopeptidase MepM/ murein hydrolase activator NlpD
VTTRKAVIANRIWTLLWTSLTVLFPLGSQARVPKHPVRGAVKKPKTLKIRQPFPCGVPIHVNCGYGPSCSPAHKRTDADNSTNDYYAVDFTRAEPGSGFNKAVVAVAPGIVRFAGWTRRGWAPYGKAVYIEPSFRDEEGHRYQTLYAHLHRVKVKAGQRVHAGQIIGTMGGSSKRRLGKLGFHLHFAMYQDAKRTLGGGRAVMPEPFGAYTDIHHGMDMIACGRPEPDRVAARVGKTSQRSTASGGLLDAD